MGKLHKGIDHAVLTEDNGGGLTLFVFADRSERKCIYAHSGYECNPKGCKEDIQALLRGDYPPTDWEGNEADPNALWQSTSEWLDKSFRDKVDYVHIVATIHKNGKVEMADPREVGNAALEAVYRFVPDPSSCCCEEGDNACYEPAF